MTEKNKCENCIKRLLILFFTASLSLLCACSPSHLGTTDSHSGAGSENTDSGAANDLNNGVDTTSESAQITAEQNLAAGKAAQQAIASLKFPITATREVAESDIPSAAAALTIDKNPNSDLSVPTYITNIDGTYFIVDCYHNTVIYNDDITAPLTDWSVMTSGIDRAHTIASDGTVYLIDDTENNRILVFEKSGGRFVETQKLDNIGVRPHYIIYNEPDKTFYAWSSMTGKMYLINRNASTNDVSITAEYSVPSLYGAYVRSFTIDNANKSIYLVSGNSSIIEASIKDMHIKKEYPVPAEMSGMVQITPIDDKFYITISTDASMNQDCATIIRCNSLSDLDEGNYEDIYKQYFIGGGTPYYITHIADTYYLTEHRIPGHSIWSFKVDSDGLPTDVTTVY